jgi:hypothetical protein
MRRVNMIMNIIDNTKLRLKIEKHGTIPNHYPTTELNTSKLGKLTLNEYQIQTIHSMLNLELNKNIDTEDDEQLVTELGVLGNKVGSGKSYCILGLISHMPKLDVQPVVKYQFSNMIYVIDNRKTVQIEGCNLIVVPHHIVKTVWEHYLIQTNFNYCIIKRNSFPLDWNTLKEFDIVLCSSKIYNEFIQECPFIWSRVIFDEADSINIPACFKPKTRFNWLVTSSLKNILFPGGYYWKDDGRMSLVRMLTKGIVRTGFIKNTCKSLESMHANYIIQNIIIKLADEYIDTMLNLPASSQMDVLCKSPYYLHVLNGLLPENIINMLNAGDFESALGLLGCTIDTKTNILKIVNDRFYAKQSNLQAKMLYLNSLQISNIHQEIEYHNKKIENTQKQINYVSQQIDSIQSKIETICDKVNYEVCPICYDNKNDLCLMKCCMNILCSSCVSSLMLHHHLKCPLCREHIINNNNIVKLRSNDDDVMETTLISKEQTLVNIIKANVSSKVLVFATYENTLGRMENTLLAENIKFKKLVGNQNSINNTIHEYNKGDLNVLLLNAYHHGCGLNLHNTTHIIFYHRMSSELEKQIVGRAQRIGRTSKLSIINLLYETE